jgi:ligand-binding SRPBCC domain-containing protein
MRCFVQTQLDAPAEVIWAAVKKPAMLVYVARGFLKFSEADHFPMEWTAGQSVKTRLWFFHVFPSWWLHDLQVMEVDDARKTIRSHEHSGFYIWDHTIHIRADSCQCRYADEINIDAGLLTLFVWLYANIFYRHRQARWRKLAQSLKQL